MNPYKKGIWENLDLWNGLGKISTMDRDVIRELSIFGLDSNLSSIDVFHCYR